MSEVYSGTLGVVLMVTGTDNNTWGTLANSSVFQIFEDAIANIVTEAVTGGTLDLSGTPPPAGPSQARYAAFTFTGVLGSNQTIQVPNLMKFWWVQNNTSGAFTLKFKTPSGAASLSIPQNAGWQLVQCDGSNGITVSPFNSRQIQMPDGAVSAPAYSNVNETNSGWYRAGTQDFRLSINGVDTLQVTGTGAAAPSVLTFQGSPLVPPGSIMAYDGITAPAGWIFLSGQALSRPIANGGSVDTFKGIWNAITTAVVGSTNGNTAITGLGTDMRAKGISRCFVEGTGISLGTTITFTGATTGTLSVAASSSSAGITLRLLPYGQGDGSSTFNVRDARDLSFIGRGDMNGTDRALVTIAGGTFDGTLLGTNRAAGDIAGGAQNQTLTQAQLPAVSPTFTGTTQVWNSTTTGIPSGTSSINGQLGPDFNCARLGTIGVISTSVTPAGTISALGSGNSHPIMGPSGVTNFIMKL